MSQQKQISIDLGEGTQIDMVWIPPGKFEMGSPEGETGRFDNEGPQHRVTISRGFWMGKYEVTQSLWYRIMKSNPSAFKGAGTNAPVENVSWNDCQEFCCKTNQIIRDKRPGEEFRLPTEAEWEYACRAETKTALYTGTLTILGVNNGIELNEIAWYGGNSGVPHAWGCDSSKWKQKQNGHTRAGTHPVGEKKANAWGLHDMIGNVWEWCSDAVRAYTTDDVTDPIGPSSGSFVRRGGSWSAGAWGCRCATRYDHSPELRLGDYGLRVVLQPLDSSVAT